MTGTMSQHAPYPAALATLVSNLTYRPGWRFELTDLDRGQGSQGLTLCIHVTGPDSYHPEKTIHVVHYMLVPPASYNERSWQWWLFEQCLLVERHECMEFFTIGGEKPYRPLHGPGNDPYLITELSGDAERRTSFRGEVTA